ncbi:3-oxoacyl-(acyl-carrier-protein) synthase [Thiohalobacter thiocyanaticus]|uniref:3-oxoacyl-(Acyl-carrier-protein) synthase n=1 Tax=Thiohalobacter thiocyanaticus TaxID=585455 RepID=A0A1Z4VQ68_9GAMM|nr:TIR domain-containing protein [Thiohalobacter thiocyanaticus]BAZ93761.1 3-oxoacyl-(acyl-carrier-protein) synthase [Thiohalobacter thiocyanaticus]
MPNVCFFSFTEADREVVLTIKGRAVNPNYRNLNFRVKDLLKRWNTEDVAVIRQAISKAMSGTSRTIVFVGERTHRSRWVREEVEMTLRNNKPVYAIRLNNTNGTKPKVLEDNGINLYNWSEERLQDLATL